MPQRNLIGEDFDQVLGNHFWSVSRASHNQQNNALQIVTFVKLKLLLLLELSGTDHHHLISFNFDS